MGRMLEGVNVVFHPNKKIAYKGEVLIGLGNTQIHNDGLVLQHKTSNKRYASLSQYVYEFDFDRNLDEYDTLFIEDLSVDTVLSIWLFMYTRNQNNFPENINVWIDYASRWEKGDTATTGEAFESYGCLQNALAISLDTMDTVTKLDKSLSFLDYLIKSNINPSHIPHNLQLSSYIDAYNALQKEYAYYDTIVSQSEVSVLNIQKLDAQEIEEVSAIFIETALVSSIHKVFLRNDRVHSPTKDGFALMAVFNSSAIGTGNDIVISVDPQKNIQLHELWFALEMEEDKLWKGMRPNDNPRPLSSYPNSDGPNEPWWDDIGNYTLLAAPKKVGTEYGRRVSWKAVKELINKLYAKGTSK